MADIKITELNPAGSEFFADDENFLAELTEEELSVWGGGGDDNLSIANSNISVGNSLGNSIANTYGNSVNISL